MNMAMKTHLGSSQATVPMYLRAALFHSTPVLDRKRRTHWNSRFNPHAKRFRKSHAKQTLVRNVSAYAEYLFQSWQPEDDGSDPSSSKGPSWFKRPDWPKGTRRNGSGFQWHHHKDRNGGGFEFCFENDEDVETIFRSAFGGERHFYWSFINEDSSRWRNSSSNSYNHRSSWNWRYRIDDDSDTSSEDDISDSDMASDRLALGLSASGPLKLEEVKCAYRVSALKWHPDRHQGSSKAFAEEKFKLCSAAYHSLCDKLATD